MKLKIQDVTINVFGISRGTDYTSISLDVKNENSYTFLMDYRNAYIEVDNVKYPGSFSNNTIWSQSFDANMEMNDVTLQFEAIPDQRRMEIVIPILIDRYDPSSGYVAETKLFSFPVEFTD